jgi:hypothetical protein
MQPPPENDVAASASGRALRRNYGSRTRRGRALTRSGDRMTTYGDKTAPVDSRRLWWVANFKRASWRTERLTTTPPSRHRGHARGGSGA